jgi:hypothetical protein
MDKSGRFASPRRIIVFFLLLSVACSAGIGARLLRAQSAAPSSADSALIADFRRVEVASVSDATEQLIGKRMYLSHRMSPIFTTKFAGFARTVQERREPQFLILTCCLTYPLHRTGRVFPARCPGRVLLGQVPFGQTPSLHPLRCRLSGVVRGLLRYSRSVRLPRSVRHRRASLDFPMRPRATAVLGELGISRFPREVLPCVHGVCDRAGLWCTSRYRCTGWGLPHLLTASASRSKSLTRLNTRPAHSLVNASTPPSRAAPHDSGPMWVAISHSYDSFIHYTSPV